MCEESEILERTVPSSVIMMKKVHDAHIDALLNDYVIDISHHLLLQIVAH